MSMLVQLKNILELNSGMCEYSDTKLRTRCAWLRTNDDCHLSQISEVGTRYQC